MLILKMFLLSWINNSINNNNMNKFKGKYNIKVSLLNFYVDSYQLIDPSIEQLHSLFERIQWLQDNSIPYYQCIPDNLHVYFCKDIDVMAFRLRWF